VECQKSSRTVSSSVDNFHNTLDYALERLGKAELFLKESLYETMKNSVCNSMDTIFPPTKIRRVGHNDIR